MGVLRGVVLVSAQTQAGVMKLGNSCSNPMTIYCFHFLLQRLDIRRETTVTITSVIASMVNHDFHS